MRDRPSAVPPDVWEWMQAHPELTALFVRAKDEGWTSERLEEVLRESDWYKESQEFIKAWDPLAYLRTR